MDLIGSNMMHYPFVMRVRVIINSLHVPIYLFAIIWQYAFFLLMNSFFSFINISFLPLCLPSFLHFLYIPYIYLFTLPRPVQTRIIDLINKNTIINTCSYACGNSISINLWVFWLPFITVIIVLSTAASEVNVDLDVTEGSVNSSARSLWPIMLWLPNVTIP